MEAAKKTKAKVTEIIPEKQNSYLSLYEQNRIGSSFQSGESSLYFEFIKLSSTESFSEEIVNYKNYILSGTLDEIEEKDQIDATDEIPSIFGIPPLFNMVNYLRPHGIDVSCINGIQVIIFKYSDLPQTEEVAIRAIEFKKFVNAAIEADFKEFDE